jgi:hypothetical protein
MSSTQLMTRKQVNRFLSALSTLQQPLVPAAPQAQVPSVPLRTLPPASSISIHSSSKHFDSFMKSINKLKSLGEARRLRADVERELRNIGLVTVDPSNESEEIRAALGKGKIAYRRENCRLVWRESEGKSTAHVALIASPLASSRLISPLRVCRQTWTSTAFYRIHHQWHTS